MVFLNGFMSYWYKRNVELLVVSGDIINGFFYFWYVIFLDFCL